MVRYDCWLDYIEVIREEEFNYRWREAMNKWRAQDIWIIGRHDKIEMC